jgi:hypothetical protein
LGEHGVRPGIFEPGKKSFEELLSGSRDLSTSSLSHIDKFTLLRLLQHSFAELCFTLHFV